MAIDTRTQGTPAAQDESANGSEASPILHQRGNELQVWFLSEHAVDTDLVQAR